MIELGVVSKEIMGGPPVDDRSETPAPLPFEPGYIYFYPQ